LKRIILALLSVLVAAAIGASVSGAATRPPAKSMAKYQACLKAHGVTFGKVASAVKTKTAFTACAKYAPTGAKPGGNGAAFRNSAAFKKFAACMTKHGVKFTAGRRPNRTSATYKAAQKACASLMPKRPANG
jgi:chitodextrinase